MPKVDELRIYPESRMPMTSEEHARFVATLTERLGPHHHLKTEEAQGRACRYAERQLRKERSRKAPKPTTGDLFAAR